MILKECVGCREYQNCKFTIADKDKLGNIIEKQGGLSYADLKQCHPCKNGQDFIEEANQIYERELFIRGMRHHMVQMRKIIGNQYMKAGQVLGDFLMGKCLIYIKMISYVVRSKKNLKSII